MTICVEVKRKFRRATVSGSRCTLDLHRWRGSTLGYRLMHRAGALIVESGGTHAMALGRSKVIDLYRRIGAEIHAETDIGGVPYAVISIEGKWSPFAGSCGNALLDLGEFALRWACLLYTSPSPRD